MLNYTNVQDTVEIKKRPPVPQSYFSSQSRYFTHNLTADTVSLDQHSVDIAPHKQSISSVGQKGETHD